MHSQQTRRNRLFIYQNSLSKCHRRGAQKLGASPDVDKKCVAYKGQNMQLKGSRLSS